jgi:hypothetical protein
VFQGGVSGQDWVWNGVDVRVFYMDFLD